MPIAATDLVLLGSANIPEDDVGASGGAIATTARPLDSQWAANAVAAVVSDGVDTRTVTITGRLASGAVDTEILTLSGVTEVVGTKTWERVLKAVLSAADAVRTVTLKQGAAGTVRHTFKVNETKAFISFQKSASEAAAVSRYEKLFWKNTHATLTLNDAKVTLTADPSVRMKIALAATKNDTGSVANRKTSPGLTFSDDNVELTVPGSILEAASGIGTWIEQALIADDTPKRDTYTLRLAGTTV